MKTLIMSSVKRLRAHLLKIYMLEGSHTKEEIEQYRAQIFEELEKKTFREIVYEYKDRFKFAPKTIERAN